MNVCLCLCKCACVDALNIHIINSIIKYFKWEWINGFRRMVWDNCLILRFSLYFILFLSYTLVAGGRSLLPLIYLTVWYNRFNCLWLLYLAKANAYFHFYYNHSAMDFQLQIGYVYFHIYFVRFMCIGMQSVISTIWSIVISPIHHFWS